MRLGKLPGKFLFFILLPLCLAATEEQLFNAPFETDLLLHKQGFSLGYSHTFRQALWVSYTLTAEHLQSPQQKRRDRFKADPEVKHNAVRPRDYSGTGFDKGHLAPAADMTYSTPSMNNSFLMTNISPQYPGCNRGIWKRLETQVRKWALKEKEIRIITGPVFSGSTQVAGKAKIPVPVAFYKVIFDLTPPRKMIGFIVPNRSSKRRVSSFAVSVDEVEKITGYDFFSELDDKVENRLEKSYSFQNW